VFRARLERLASQVRQERRASQARPGRLVYLALLARQESQGLRERPGSLAQLEPPVCLAQLEPPAYLGLLERRVFREQPDPRPSLDSMARRVRLVPAEQRVLRASAEQPEPLVFRALLAQPAFRAQRAQQV